ncbi:MAG: hypothetical protein AAF617_04930 [Bacteroidota bacterium]
MKKKYMLLLLCALNAIPLLSQQQSVEEEYASYFSLPREALHVHLNKTTFFKGEEVWFKGYAYDQKNQLSSKATTNINVGIYDAAGNQVKKALFAAENGVTYGNFAIDSTFAAGTYYLKAETNWMKNFKEDNAFIQKIEIVTEEALRTEKETVTEKFDFQFLPEGGHIVADVKNSVGFKVINNNGKGVTASGIVYDNDRKQVGSFESNTLGMGKFLFQPEENKQYTAEITLENGTVINKNLPKATAQGIALTVQSLSKEHVILDFATNAATLENNPDKSYKILIHQNGKLKTVLFQFDALKKAIRIPKKELFSGIITVTVFDNDQNPILERLFFNEYGITQTDISIAKLNTVQDSILLSVKALNLNTNANLSISILPEATESYNPKHSIRSSFYLKPHVRGIVENPQYYFHNMDRRKTYELDVLLLTQGWSRYEWKAIFGEKPTAKYRFENGIALSGRVNVPTSGVKQVFLYATKHHNSKFIDLDSDQRFELAGLFLEEDETLRFSYITENGPMRKPSMYVRFLTPDKEDKISDAYLEETKNIRSETAAFTIPKDFFYKKAEALETVVLKAEKEKPKYDSFFLINPKVNEITMEEYIKYINLVEYLNFNGFNAGQTTMGDVQIASRLAQGGVPAVFYNDIRIRNFSIFYDMSLAEIERIVIDRYASAPSIDERSIGIIKIYSRKTPLFKKSGPEIPYLKASAPVAFARQKQYYAPNYTSYLNPVFQKYGAISWHPVVELNTKTATTFKIYDTYTKNITVLIEGISENGDLISERKTITVR